MIGDPASQPHADRRDLVLLAIGVNDPDSDALRSSFALDSEMRQRADQPILEAAYKASHVGFAPAQVEHDVSDALSRAVIGELPAAAGLENRKSCVEQVGGIGACACRVNRR